jgi:large subunit ribosomal protein L9
VEVVLRQDVDHVGLRGDVVNDARGDARNYLLPRGLAEVATPGLKRELERRDSLRARNEAKTTDEAQAIARRLEANELRFEMNAGPTGSLFGSVTATNIVDRLWDEQKIRIDRRKLGMQTIKRIGRYTVEAEVFADETAQLSVLVVPEGGELPPEEPEATEAAPAVEQPAGETAPAAEDATVARDATVAEETDVEAPPEERAPVAEEPAAAEPEAAAGTGAVEEPAQDVAADEATPEDGSPAPVGETP